MKKDEFFAQLRNAFAGMDEELIMDILSDYENHFKEGMENGKSEEEICEELGNVEEIRQAFLDENPAAMTINVNSNSDTVGNSDIYNRFYPGIQRVNAQLTDADIEIKKSSTNIESESLYQLMTSVQQNVFVFNDTIRNNVTMFHEFSDKEVTLALERSGLSELIEKRGEDFVCGENGANLSGGERQRISIARALLRKSPILLVDEATAALDAATARAVSFSILNLVGMTRIVVTHRLEEAILRRYDKILVMKNGTICEQGNFDTLMQQKGQFYSLFQIAH